MIIKVINELGLYSKGGYNVSFTKRGKSWSSLGYLKNHLNQLKPQIIEQKYLNCKIMIINELENTKNETILFKDFYKTYKEELDFKNKKKTIEDLIYKAKMLKEEIKNIDKRKEFCLDEIERIEKLLINTKI